MYLISDEFMAFGRVLRKMKIEMEFVHLFVFPIVLDSLRFFILLWLGLLQTMVLREMQVKMKLVSLVTIPMVLGLQLFICVTSVNYMTGVGR